MKWIKTVLLVVILGGGTLLAGVATFSGLGVQQAAHPQGISIRDDSVRTTRTGVVVPLVRGGRIHRGGGIARGK